MTEKKILGYWDCSSCGSKKIPGTEENCPHCGAPKGNTKCYIDVNHKEYLDTETAKEYGKGANWICPYCGNQNRYYSTHCIGCGAAKTDSTEDYFGNNPNENGSQTSEEHPASYYERSSVLTREISKKKNSSYDSDYDDYTNYASNNFSDSDYEKTFKGLSSTLYDFWSSRKKSILTSISIFLSIIALIVTVVIIFAPHNYEATVTASSWEATVSIEEYKTVKESDWYVPEGGRVYKTVEEFHHYDSVLDHYDTVTEEKSRQVIDHYDTHVEYSYSDNGDGTFTEHTHTVSDPVYRTEYYTETKQEPVYVQVPRYQTKFYYEIERWVYNRTEKSSGKDNEQPHWPAYELAENERVSEKNDTYLVIFTTKDEKEYKKKVSATEWHSLPVGKKVEITVQAGIVTKFKILTISDIIGF